MNNKKTYLEDFRTNLLSCNFSQVEKTWRQMPASEKEHIRKEINSLPRDMRRDIHVRLNMANEYLAIDILGESPVSSKVHLDGRWFGPKEIRDMCLTNVKSVPRFIMAIFSLKEIEKMFLLNDIKKIDIIFYNSIMASLGRLEAHTNDSLEKSKTLDCSIEKRNEVESKTPITYLCEYVQDKAEILSFFSQKLREKGLTPDQISRLIEIESQTLGPEVFKDGNSNSKNTA